MILGSFQPKEFCDPMKADTEIPAESLVLAVLLMLYLRYPRHYCCVSARTLLFSKEKPLFDAIVYFFL